MGSSECFMAWMHWDPNSVAFMIPFLDHPVRWYGILFVIGFALSYFIMVRLLAVKINQARKFSDRDITDWDAFLGSLQHGLRTHEMGAMDDILGHLSPKQQAKLRDWRPGVSPQKSLKDALIKALNEALQIDPEFEGDRSRLEELEISGLVTTRQHAMLLADSLVVYVILGTVIGARLGHVFFYDWVDYSADPLSILKVWEGGLASHGGAVGVLVGLALFRRQYKDRYRSLTLLNLLDYVSLCGGLAGAFIRIGNFFNQEILGKVTAKPWAVIFGHPADRSIPAPRHPVQLYEAAFCLIVFLILSKVWIDRGGRLQPGRLFGAFLTLIFSFRIFVEFFKEPQSLLIEGSSGLLMGQWLSLPFILVGLYFWFFKKSLRDARYFS